MFVSGPSILASLAISALSKINAATATKSAPTSSDPLSAAPAKSAKDEFMDYAKLTPAQKMRAAMLARMGLTEDQIKAMPRGAPEDRRPDQAADQTAGRERSQQDEGIVAGRLGLGPR
jgi:hypothetical protein